MFISESRKDTFTTLGPALMICQSAAVLEVLHPLLGWVKTGVIAIVLQVRDLLTFLALSCCDIDCMIPFV